ncbi:MAG: hypothetical protein K8R35_05245, partial [Bacteroidales bacterium]|nr:hypothetical protein [Bacteroidales bacterium]
DRRKITDIASDVFKELTISNPDYLATACPLCKKTFGKVSNEAESEIKDIAEIVAMAIVPELSGNIKLSKRAEPERVSF